MIRFIDVSRVRNGLHQAVRIQHPDLMKVLTVIHLWLQVEDLKGLDEMTIAKWFINEK